MIENGIEYPDTRLLAEMQVQWENQQRWIEQATNAISGNDTLKRKHTCLCNLTEKAKGIVDNDVLDYIDSHSHNIIDALSKYRLSQIAEFIKVCGNRLTEKCIAFKVQGYTLNATLYQCKYWDVLNAVTNLEQAYKYNRDVMTHHAISDEVQTEYFSKFNKPKEKLFYRFGIEACRALCIKYDTFRRELYKPWEDLKFIPDEAERYLHTCRCILLFLALRNEVTLVEEEMKLYEEPFTPYAKRGTSPSPLQTEETSQENAEKLSGSLYKLLQQIVEQSGSQHKTLQQIVEQSGSQHKTLQQIVGQLSDTQNKLLQQIVEQSGSQHKTLQQIVGQLSDTQNELLQQIVEKLQEIIDRLSADHTRHPLQSVEASQGNAEADNSPAPKEDNAPQSAEASQENAGDEADKYPAKTGGNKDQTFASFFFSNSYATNIDGVQSGIPKGGNTKMADYFDTLVRRGIMTDIPSAGALREIGITVNSNSWSTMCSRRRAKRNETKK